VKKEGEKKEGEKEGEEKMEVEEEFEVKKTKKEKYSAIKYDANTFDNFNSKDIEAFFTAESTMVNQDRLILETYEKKNELESLIYRWKSNITSSHQEFTRPEEVQGLLAFLENENEWLYNDGQNSNRGTYNERINAVRNKVAHIAKKYENFDLLVHDVKALGDSLAANANLLNSLVNHSPMQDKKHEHITPE
jgi:heat shock 70kDa protein 4